MLPDFMPGDPDRNKKKEWNPSEDQNKDDSFHNPDYRSPIDRFHDDPEQFEKNLREREKESGYRMVSSGNKKESKKDKGNKNNTPASAGDKPSFLIGFNIEGTYSFPRKDGLTGAFGVIGSLKTGVYSCATIGTTKGTELSGGINLTIVIPIKSSFTMSDLNGKSSGIDGNKGLYSFGLTTNSTSSNPLGGSYIQFNLGLGVGIGGSVSQTNSVNYQLTNDQVNRMTFGTNAALMH
jgi:hypothetical protein